MYKKLGIISIIFMSVFCGYSLVFAGDFFDDSITSVFQVSSTLYPDSLPLRSTKMVFRSRLDLSEMTLFSKCEMYAKNIAQNGDLYLFDIKILEPNCKERYFSIQNHEGETLEKFKLNIRNDYTLFSSFLDYNTDKLKVFRNALDKKILRFMKYKEYDRQREEDYYVFLQKNRLLQELEYVRNIIHSIITGRQDKYAIPVVGMQLSNHYSKIPNSPRPYREGYTDGIHHGWDIDTDLGEQVVALDDGIIVRVVSGFEFDDLNALEKTNNLTYEQKLRNLDILRGNQVWLKTMKGDVVFYSHLNDIIAHIKEGTVVKKGEPLGTVGITGVPDKKYNDFHLHFVIHKNPFYPKMVGKYDYEDYMSWNWEFQGKTADYIVKNQYNIFEK